MPKGNAAWTVDESWEPYDWDSSWDQTWDPNWDQGWEEFAYEDELPADLSY